MMSAGIGNEAGNSRSKMLEKRMRASVRLHCPVLVRCSGLMPVFPERQYRDGNGWW
jgi:hypothetical protein